MASSTLVSKKTRAKQDYVPSARMVPLSERERAQEAEAQAKRARFAQREAAQFARAHRRLGAKEREKLLRQQEALLWKTMLEAAGFATTASRRSTTRGPGFLIRSHAR